MRRMVSDSLVEHTGNGNLVCGIDVDISSSLQFNQYSLCKRSFREYFLHKLEKEHAVFTVHMQIQPDDLVQLVHGAPFWPLGRTGD